jgi:hypothetical protein
VTSDVDENTGNTCLLSMAAWIDTLFLCDLPVGWPAVSQSPAPMQPKQTGKGMVHGIRPDELVKLTPKLKPYLRRPDPTWPDIVDAADWLRHDLRVSKSLWGNACLAMGRELAALALAIVSAKEAEHSRTSQRLLPTAWSPKPGPANCTSNDGVGDAARLGAGASAGQGRGLAPPRGQPHLVRLGVAVLEIIPGFGYRNRMKHEHRPDRLRVWAEVRHGR